MYEVSDLLSVVKKHINNCELELAKRKKNISSDYVLALSDIKIIQNFEDHKKVCENIEKELNELQKTIINRNRRNV